MKQRILTTKLFATIVLLLISIPVSAQSTSITEKEVQLQSLFEKLKEAQSDSITLSVNTQIEKLFKNTLQEEESFDYEFAKLKYVGKILSDDGLLRIISWNYPLKNGNWGYNTFFLFKTNKKVQPRVYFVATQMAFKPEINTKYSTTDWYGSLYYQAVKNKKKKQYMLLGFSTYKSITKTKVIDVLTINGNNMTFGSPLFKSENNKLQKRVVFEYGSNVQMGLEYDKKRKQFIFDHLSPSDAIYTGTFYFYGPDFTFDAYSQKKNYWVFQRDIDIKNK